MSEEATPSSPPTKGFIQRLFQGPPGWRNARRALIALAAAVTVVALFYAVEDWRGKRAWEECKRQLAAQGAVLDWSAHIPKPLPDDQNVFKAPKMEEWFVRGRPGGGSSSLNLRLNKGLADFVWKRGTDPVAEVTIVPIDATVAPQDADIVLRFEPPLLTLSAPETPAARPEPAIPLIVMDNVPILDAITNLARQANLKYVLDPKILWGKSGPQPLVTVRWENLTSRQALLALLNNYSLLLVDDPKSGVARITVKNPAAPEIHVDPDARDQLGGLVRRAFGLDTNAPSLEGSLGYLFITEPLKPGKPARVFVRADKIPSTKEIAEFFPADALAPGTTARGRCEVQPAGGSFRVLLNPAGIYNAADYIAWSDSFTNDFDTIREALKRPQAQIPGDYQRLAFQPIPNFVNHRIVAQTLADRTRCFLLLGRPADARRELTLLHDMHRLQESEPTTLVAAMINVAVTGLYTTTVADGLRLRAWRAPELAAIQQQLGEVNLPRLVSRAYDAEAAMACGAMETMSADEFAKYFLAPVATAEPAGFWARIGNPRYLLFAVMPRGWVYRNMAVTARLDHKLTEGFDLTNNLVLPGRMAELNDEQQQEFRRFSPYTFVAAEAAGNFVRATQTTARNQTQATEALIACALERHRLAQGDYPETLDALVPRFADRLPHDLIGGQALKYRRMDGSKFLLYSVGWNERDDGGTPGKPPQEISEGDWVWK